MILPTLADKALTLRSLEEPKNRWKMLKGMVRKAAIRPFARLQKIALLGRG